MRLFYYLNCFALLFFAACKSELSTTPNTEIAANQQLVTEEEKKQTLATNNSQSLTEEFIEKEAINYDEKDAERIAKNEILAENYYSSKPKDIVYNEDNLPIVKVTRNEHFYYIEEVDLEEILNRNNVPFYRGWYNAKRIVFDLPNNPEASKKITHTIDGIYLKEMNKPLLTFEEVLVQSYKELDVQESKEGDFNNSFYFEVEDLSWNQAKKRLSLTVYRHSIYMGLSSSSIHRIKLVFNTETGELISEKSSFG